MTDKRTTQERIANIFSPHERAVRAKMKELKQKYFSTARDQEILDGLKSLLDPDASDPKGADEEEPLALCVTGMSQAGKSRTLKRNIVRGLGFNDYQKPSCPIAYTCAPSPCTLKRLGHDILENTGYPMVAERTEHYAWGLVRSHLPQIGAVALHIDEMQNATETANSKQAKAIVGMLKTFLVRPSQRMPLILSGTPDLADFLEKDTQIRSRTQFIQLRPISPVKINDRNDVGDAIKMLTEIAGLRFDDEDHLIARLLHAALYQYGLSIKLSRFAIGVALMRKDQRLTVQHFATDWAARTGNAPSQNPFLAPNWRAIDCTGVHKGWDEKD